MLTAALSFLAGDSRRILVRHEPLTVGAQDFVLNDCAGGIALKNPASAAIGFDVQALGEFEYAPRVDVIECVQTAAPVDSERSESMHLHDRAVRRVCKHRTALGSERVAAGLELLQRAHIELLADPEIPGALQDRHVLIDRMPMRRNDRSRKLVNAHHEGPTLLRVAV